MQAGDAILDLAAGGQHDHRQTRTLIDELGENLGAAAARQHQVQHDELNPV